MRGLLLFNDSFPIGRANANRMHSIAKGLNENGVNTKVIILRPTEFGDTIYNIDRKGIYEGVLFEYLSASTVKSNSVLKRIIHNCLLLFKLVFILFKLRKEIAFVIYPLDSLFTLILVKSVLMFSRIQIVRHVDEFPPFVLNPQRYSSLYTWIYRKLFYRLVDSVIVITKTLEGYYRSICNKNIEFLHLPMTVDINRFSINDNNAISDYIAYCGNLGHNNKDGLPDLIKAFHIVHKEYPHIYLRIIGSSNNPNDIQELIDLSDRLGLSSNIIFMGSIPSTDVPIWLTNAIALALSRPANKQAEGGFPTKLGEYLATGKPVIVTSVGEIPLYLEHKVNAFIAEPGNYLDFGNKILDVLKDYNDALKIGQRGRMVANQFFNYEHQGKILADFIKRSVQL